MPTYVYQCQGCGTTFDVRASIKEKEAGLNPECPACHDKETRQMMTAGLFVQRSNGGGMPSFAGCAPGAGAGCCG